MMSVVWIGWCLIVEKLLDQEQRLEVEISQCLVHGLLLEKVLVKPMSIIAG